MTEKTPAKPRSPLNIRPTPLEVIPDSEEERQRRIIESSDDESEPEIIEISDSSVPNTPVKPYRSDPQPRATTPSSPMHVVVDESILILDEPRSARTPLRVGKRVAGPSCPASKDGIRPNRVTDLTTPVHTPNSSTKKMPASQTRSRLNSKKAILEADLKRRKDYAQQLFSDLNELVFKQGLPSDTQLNWNKRLVSTAGRARFHRSREGVQTTEIELAEKILDCDERIRNTLSHEMCHLATWVIDKKIDEHHGKLFKYWASLVMKKRPDIHVSVSLNAMVTFDFPDKDLCKIKHDYEISYPFEWRFDSVMTILVTHSYGRFSKSIRPDECVCGACKEGALVPLFSTRTPAKKTPKLSKMAPAKPQDSPISVHKKPSSGHEPDSDDSEIEVLTSILAVTGIGHDDGD
ncbi:hypothetical protein CVT26_007574 [Gymnopilus dilepis]|uniref:SprT-like domain-containing protein n=1 Tax=Gymnopilus dilepis TaxID=231916 RepID=A0A409WI55_9AGAR|nr:hypothetical protein CVT26_007574 [Gymnopilus dilepis]